MCSNPSFRAKRIAQECGSVTDPELHQSCVASFDCGPPKYVGKRARYASLPTFAPRMRETGLFVLDTVGAEERRMLRDWREWHPRPLRIAVRIVWPSGHLTISANGAKKPAGSLSEYPPPRP